MTHDDDEPTPADPQADPPPPPNRPDQFAELRAAPEPLSVHFAGFTLSVLVPPELAVAAAGIFGEKMGGEVVKANRERLKGLDAVGVRIGKSLAGLIAPVAAKVEELAARMNAAEKAAAPPEAPPQPPPPPECADGIAPGVPLN